VDRNEPRVLAAGLGRMAFDRLAPELQRDSLGVEWAETPEAGVALAKKSRYDVIIMDAEPCERPLEDVIRELRASKSLSRDAAVLILVEPDQVDAVRALKSHGVNRIMLISDPPEIIREQMTTLLDVAPRATVRLPTNLESVLGDTGRELYCQTENLSMSGMLVKTRHRPQLGSKVTFKIDLSDPVGTILGRGEFVRHSTPDQGSVDGLGVKFLSFADDGAQLLQNYLDRLNREPDPTPATRSATDTPPKPERLRKLDPDITLEFE
jgi:PilZ domain